MITHVFLDVDGVLADFTGHALQMLDRADFIDNYPAGEYSIDKLVGLTQEEFWGKLDSDYFWRTIPPFNGTFKFVRDLYELCHDLNAALFYCTVGTVHQYFSSARAKWLQQMNFGAGVHTPPILLPTWEDKILLAAPGRVFVDDNLLILNAVEAAGATAIRVPQPWNCSTITDVTTPDYDRVLQQVRKAFKYEMYRDSAGPGGKASHCESCRSCRNDCVATARVGGGSDKGRLRVYCGSLGSGKGG